MLKMLAKTPARKDIAMSDMHLLTQMEAGNAEPVQESAKTSGNDITVTHSESLGNLALALASAQLEFETVVKGTENPYYRSHYADLSAIIAATQKPLARHGLVVIQSPIVNVDKQEAGVTSLMVHKSGEWIRSELVLPATMLGRDGKPRFDSQSCGSAQTYSRRYAYQALIGVAAEPDDDGNSSTGMGSREAAQAVAQRKIAASGKKPVATKVDMLFYVLPEAHNGNKAEFINIAQYLASNQDREHEIRYAFSAVKATKTKDETALVATERLQDLLNVLAGDLGIAVQQLQPGAQP